MVSMPCLLATRRGGRGGWADLSRSDNPGLDHVETGLPCTPRAESGSDARVRRLRSRQLIENRTPRTPILGCCARLRLSAGIRGCGPEGSGCAPSLVVFDGAELLVVRFPRYGNRIGDAASFTPLGFRLAGRRVIAKAGVESAVRSLHRRCVRWQAVRCSRQGLGRRGWYTVLRPDPLRVKVAINNCMAGARGEISDVAAAVADGGSGLSTP